MPLILNVNGTGRVARAFIDSTETGLTSVNAVCFKFMSQIRGVKSVTFKSRVFRVILMDCIPE